MLQQQSHSQHNGHHAYSYASTNISKTRQLVMAYDGILSMVMRARQAIQENDHEARFIHLEKACKIIMSLQTALDHARGGEIAKILDNMYFSFDIRLLRQNMEPNVEKLDQVIQEIRSMRDAWADVDSQMIAIPNNDVMPAFPSPEEANTISVSA